jgi:hypothetical protein
VMKSTNSSAIGFPLLLVLLSTVERCHAQRQLHVTLVKSKR